MCCAPARGKRWLSRVVCSKLAREKALARAARSGGSLWPPVRVSKSPLFDEGVLVSRDAHLPGRRAQLLHASTPPRRHMNASKYGLRAASMSQLLVAVLHAVCERAWVCCIWKSSNAVLCKALRTEEACAWTEPGRTYANRQQTRQAFERYWGEMVQCLHKHVSQRRSGPDCLAGPQTACTSTGAATMKQRLWACSRARSQALAPPTLPHRQQSPCPNTQI